MAGILCRPSSSAAAATATAAATPTAASTATRGGHGRRCCRRHLHLTLTHELGHRRAASLVIRADVVKENLALTPLQRHGWVQRLTHERLWHVERHTLWVAVDGERDASRRAQEYANDVALSEWNAVVLKRASMAFLARAAKPEAELVDAKLQRRRGGVRPAHASEALRKHLDGKCGALRSHLDTHACTHATPPVVCSRAVCMHDVRACVALHVHERVAPSVWYGCRGRGLA